MSNKKNGGFFMNLREFRQKKDLSQKELSEAVGIPQTTLFGYEMGRCEANIENLIKLADYYHVTLDELVGRPTSLINKMVLSDLEKRTIEKFLSLNPKFQELTEFYIDTLNRSL